MKYQAYSYEAVGLVLCGSIETLLLGRAILLSWPVTKGLLWELILVTVCERGIWNTRMSSIPCMEILLDYGKNVFVCREESWADDFFLAEVLGGGVRGGLISGDEGKGIGGFGALAEALCTWRGFVA